MGSVALGSVAAHVNPRYACFFTALTPGIGLNVKKERRGGRTGAALFGYHTTRSVE